MKTLQDSQSAREIQSSTQVPHESQSDHQNNTTEAPVVDSGSIYISSNDNRKVSRKDIEFVQNLIERCLHLYMNKDEVVKTLLSCARIDPGFTTLVWQKFEEAKYRLPISKSKEKSFIQSFIESPNSSEFLKVVAHTLSHNFRRVTSIVCMPLRLSIKPRHVLVKIIYAGVNASDVNFSSSRYLGGNDKDPDSRLPFDVGFQTRSRNCCHANLRTHSINYFRKGSTNGIRNVTAAVGGTGRFAVQLAKSAGNRVIATCEDPSVKSKTLSYDLITYVQFLGNELEETQRSGENDCILQEMHVIPTGIT
ncbi:hypothetical protein VitviT2T_005209 [Vitis vinifera]|uniref:Uncharacterized protein n=1 Tax=Vitis vinifera TaxID=29760 RepID=A0ABY9BSZ9_VITVI|nr:hypothetical protein VitviT2T_005209 [Vitis vinifera]